MKTLFPCILIFAAAATGWSATGNSPNTVIPLFQLSSASLRPANGTATNGTEIISQSAYFDLKERTAIYLGDVRVHDPRMELACEVLTVKFAAESGAKFPNIIAETNVVIDFFDAKGQKVHATGGKAVYTYNVTKTYTNDVMELTDNPMLKSPQGDVRGKVISIDLVSNSVKVSGYQITHIPQSPGSTNDSPLNPLK